MLKTNLVTLIVALISLVYFFAKSAKGTLLEKLMSFGVSAGSMVGSLLMSAKMGLDVPAEHLQSLVKDVGEVLK
jgi:hypothetical protein